MRIPVNELTPNDYLLLKYIAKYKSVSKEQIEKHFYRKIDSIEYRLNYLSKSDCYSVSGTSIPVQNSSYIEEEFDIIEDDIGCAEYLSKNIFSITPLGVKCLQDYSLKKRTDRRLLWTKNAWIPIIVAFVTTVLTNYIIPKLPLLIEWFLNFL